MQSICVYCGANVGANPAYREATATLGRLIASEGLALVYGGGHVGLMGVIADSALAAGGRVIGIIPQALADRELAHAGLTELMIVGSMHERKTLMAERSDGFIALPGGYGTFEEFFEIVTWAQLGIHGKPCGVLNIAGYYDCLLALLDRATEDRFVRREHRVMVLESSQPEELLARMAAYTPPKVEKWIDRDQT